MRRGFPLLGAALLGASALAVVFLAGRDSVTDPAPVAAEVPARLPGEPVHFVLASRWAPIEGYGRLGAMVSCLEGLTGRPVERQQRRRYAEANALVASGDADVAVVCSGATGDPRLRERMDAAWRLGGSTGGDYHGLVVVRADDPAKGLEDLHGAPVAWTDPDSLTGYRAVRAELRRAGKDPDAWFGAASFTWSHDASIAAVADGLVRAAPVDEQVFAGSTVTGLRVVWRSEAFPAPPVLVRRGDRALAEAVAGLAGRPDCLGDLGATHLVPTDWSDYDRLAETIELGR